MSEQRDHESAWATDDPVAPAVIGAESASPPDETALPADVVYLPTQRYSPGDRDVIFRLLDVDGQLALPVFSSLELLVAGCGTAQPWVMLRPDSPGGLVELARTCGAYKVLWDVEFPAEERIDEEEEEER